MAFIANRKARFFNFKIKECFPEAILQKPADWKLIFNGEDWSSRRVYYANEEEGMVIRYEINDEGQSFIRDGEVAELEREKGRVRILKIGDEIDTVENIWGIYREEE